MKTFAIGIAAVLVLLIGAVLILPAFIDWNRYKPQIVEAAQRVTGRTLSIDGDIEFRMLPVPALSVDGVRLSNLADGSAPDMARLRSLDIRVALMPLLNGEVQVQSVRLVAPVILLEVTPSGRANWEFAAGAAGSAGGSGLDRLDFRFEKFVLSDATLIYRNGVTGTEQRFEGIALEGSAASLIGPFIVDGELQAAGLPLTFDARIGQLAGRRVVPLHLAIRASPGDTVVELDGTLSEASTQAKLTGTIDARAGDLAALLQAGTGASGGILAARALALEGRIEATLEQATINDMTLQFGDVRATGAVSTPLAGGIAPDVALQMNRLDLDQLLSGPDGTVPPAGPSYPALPADLQGTLDLTIDGVALRGGILRQVQVTASLAEGRLSLSRLSALMPGGSDVNLSGSVAMDGDLPRLDGRLELVSVDLRGLLHWLNVDASAVPAGRLGNLALTSQVRATPRLVEIFDGNLRLDATTITGGLAFFVQRRPSFSAALQIDRVNLDGYLPPGSGTRDNPGATTADVPLELLNGFDTRLKLEFGQVIYKRTPIRDLAVQLDLIGGVLTVHHAGIGDLAGAKTTLAGSARDFGKEPAFDFNMRLAAESLAGLARTADLELPVAPSQLGQVALDATVAGTLSRLQVASEGTIAGARLSMKGQIAGLADEPSIALRLLMDHQSLATVSRALGIGIAPIGDADGPLSLAASVEGGASDLGIDLKLDLVGASAQVQGRLLELAGTPELELTIGAGADSLSRLLRSVGIEAEPMPDPGEFGLSAEISGNAGMLTVSELSARLGPTTAKGTATLTLDRPRPHLRARIEADELRPDLFLPASAPAGGDVRWSRQPFDWSALNALDADIELSARTVALQDVTLSEPKLAAQLSDGVLRVSELTGRLFEGAVNLQAELTSRPLPALKLTYSLGNANMQQALQAAFGLDRIDGTMTIEGRLQTSGTSEWGLVNRLEGDGNIELRDAVVRGIDLAGIGSRLDELADVQTLLDVVAGAFSGGETRFSEGGGTWQIRNGIASTQDMRATSEAGEAALAGRINLPAQEMDLTGTFTLAGHPDAPPIGLRLHGPLDAPARELNTGDLQTYLVGRVLQEGLQRSLEGGEPAPEQDKPSPSGQPRPTDAEKAFRDALEELLRTQ